MGVDELLDPGFGGPQEGDWPDPADQLRKRERQKSLVAELGRSALTGTPLERLVEDAVAAATEGLGADRVGLLEPTNDGSALVCRSSRGWPEGELRPVPVAVMLKLAVVPGQLVSEPGGVEIATFWLTVSIALFVTKLPHVPLTTTL